MLLSDYEIKIVDFDKYPDASKPHIYFLGLGGEFGEAVEKVQTNQSEEEIIKEFGDVLWYLTRIASEYGFSIAELDKNKGEPTKVKTLNGAIGQILEFQKKVIRDKGGVKVNRDPVLYGRMLDVMYLFAKKSILFGHTLEEVADINYNKLKSRHERGAISGDGDNR